MSIFKFLNRKWILANKVERNIVWIRIMEYHGVKSSLTAEVSFYLAFWKSILSLKSCTLLIVWQTSICLKIKHFLFSSATREKFLKAAYEGNLTSLETLLPQVDVNYAEEYDYFKGKVSSEFYSVISKNSKLYKYQEIAGKFLLEVFAWRPGLCVGAWHSPIWCLR